MAYEVDIRKAYLDTNPVLFWANRGDPFIIGSQQAAYSGKIASQRLATTSLVGSPMIVTFILARAAHIIAWQGMARNNPFNTTSLHSSFVTGHKVIFQFDSPIVFDNTLLKDRKYDINQDIFTYGDEAYKRGLDVWEGTLKLIITE